MNENKLICKVSEKSLEVKDYKRYSLKNVNISAEKKVEKSLILELTLA